MTSATDVYALGVLLRELMIGHASPSRDLATEVQRIARRSLADDPAERFPDAGALATELERVLRRHSIEAGVGRHGLPAARRGWTRRLLAFGAAATGSVAVVTLVTTAGIVISRLARGDADEVSLGEVSSTAPNPGTRAVTPIVAQPAPPTGTIGTPLPEARVAAAGGAGAESALPGEAAARSTKPPSASLPVPLHSSDGAKAASGAGDSTGAAERRRGAGRINARRAAVTDTTNSDELRKLAGLYGVRGLTVPALALMDSVVGRVSASEGPTSVSAAYARAQRSVLQLQLGTLDAAGRDLAFADTVLRSAQPRPDTLIADADLFSGALALLRGHPDSALARFEASYAVRLRTRGAHPKRAAAACGMGLALESLGRAGDAASWQPFCSMQQRWPRGFYRPMVELLREGASRKGSVHRN